MKPTLVLASQAAGYFVENRGAIGLDESLYRVERSSGMSLSNAEMIQARIYTMKLVAVRKNVVKRVKSNINQFI